MNDAGQKGVSKRLPRRVALVLALLSLWLVGTLGYYLVFRLGSRLSRLLPGLEDDTIAWLLVGSLYLERCASMLPSVVIAGYLIWRSDSSRPARAAFWTVFAYHLVSLVLRMILKWPWSVVPELNPAIPVVCELVSLLVLSATAPASIWLLNWLNARLARKRAGFLM
jgi:hypothetical protein